MSKPTTEGFFWYKNQDGRKTVVETERRPDTGALYMLLSLVLPEELL